MRRFALFAPALALAVLALGGETASAQVTNDYYYGDDVPPVYRYEPDDAPRVFVPRVDAYGNVYTIDRPFGRNGCGTYRFWNGERCVDARYR
jgi:hypothetical protein